MIDQLYRHLNGHRRVLRISLRRLRHVNRLALLGLVFVWSAVLFLTPSTPSDSATRSSFVRHPFNALTHSRIWPRRFLAQQAAELRSPPPPVRAPVLRGYPPHITLWFNLIWNQTYNVPYPNRDFATDMLGALFQLQPLPKTATDPTIATSTLHCMAQITKSLTTLAQSTVPPENIAPMRRLCTAMLHHRKQQLLASSHPSNTTATATTTHKPSWSSRHEAELQQIQMLWFHLHLQHASGRAIELTHISKTAGTSMCHLATSSNCSNPYNNTKDNCMLPTFNDYPAWTQALDVEHEHQTVRLAPPFAVECPDYHQNAFVQGPSCETRAFIVKGKAVQFYSRERQLCEGSSDPADSHTCRQLVTALMLRPPTQHVPSLLAEVFGAYRTWLSKAEGALRSYVLPTSLPFWKQAAPAVLDNYFTRTLLGRYFMCLPFGSIQAEHQRYAVAKLLTFDVLLDLNSSRVQQDQVTRLGLGWDLSLGDVHDRQGTAQLGSGPGGLDGDTVLQHVANWTTHDQVLYRHGSMMSQLDAQLWSEAAEAIRQAGDVSSGLGRRLRLLDEASHSDGAVVRPLGRGGLAAMHAAVSRGSQQCGYVGLMFPAVAAVPAAASAGSQQVAAAS